MPAAFVRSAQVSGYVTAVPWQLSLVIQVDIGDLVVVGSVSASQNPANDLTVTDLLPDMTSNSYAVAVQGFKQDFGVSGHAGDAQIAYAIVTHAGMSAITLTCSPSPQRLGLMVSVYTIPAGMTLDQVDWLIGDIQVPSGATQVAFGTAPVNYADSLVITLASEGGYCLNYTSMNVDYSTGTPVFTANGADTKRLQIPGGPLSGAGSIGGGAFFDSITSSPGIRNSVVLAENNPGGSCATSSHEGFSNILIAVWSKPLPRPPALTSQAAVRPGKGGVLGGYQGQTQVRVSLPYLPKIGSLVLIGCATGYGGGSKPIPPFTVGDTYGNIYTPLGTNASGIRLEADALFSTIVTVLPTNGVFAVDVSVPPFPSPDGAAGSPKSITISEYYLPGAGPFQVLVFSGNPSIGGGLMRLFTDSIGVAGRTLIAGFGACRFGVNAPLPVPWNTSGGFTIDTSWGYWQVDLHPLNQAVRIGLGNWFHQYINAPGTYDAETITQLTGATGIMAVAIPAPAPEASCPIVSTGQVGVLFSAQIQVSFGVPPYTFALIAGSLPPGFILDAGTGIITGIATIVGSYSFTIRVTDSLGATATTASCPITITICISPKSALTPPPAAAFAADACAGSTAPTIKSQL